ncbi:hypothetical protein GCM10022240_20820 [Microbacterium kribbense]|uniref:Large extracellular alpha-helical protein n=1 Tax=Microbacterium kribbense TaxID=433645 RepID=A0ABP7GLH1_9MICO
MTRASRIGVAARFTAGGVIAVAASVAIAGGVAFGWMPHTATPLSQQVAPTAADAVLTCAGPLLAIGRDATAAAEIAVAGSARVTSAGDELRTDRLATTGMPAQAGPTRLVAAAAGRTVPHAAGAASASVTSPDLSGFAASACTPALMQSWLVGGSSATGAADMILLANPGTVAATVDLVLYGPDGPRPGGAGSNIIIAPGTQRVIPLAGLGLDQSAPIVRVTATGAPVRASLQSSITRGLAPGGVDQSGAIAAGSTMQVIPGVRVTSAPQDQPTTIVRIVSPGAATTASVTVLGPHGPMGPAQQVPLEDGGPIELKLDDLMPGTYTVVVGAAHPVVAAVWQATGTGGGSDFAWVNSAPTLTAADGTLFMVPAGPAPALAVAVTGTQPATLTLTPAAGGTAQKVNVAAGQTASLAVNAGTAYRLIATGPVQAAVTFAGPDALASFPVGAQDVASAPVVVYP